MQYVDHILQIFGCIRCGSRLFTAVYDHYSDDIMTAVASQITGVTIIYSTFVQRR